MNKYLEKVANMLYLKEEHVNDANKLLKHNLKHNSDKTYNSLNEDYKKKFARNTVIGNTVIGAGLGTALGSIHGHPGVMAAGAGAGALVGGAVGYARRHSQKNTDNASFIAHINTPIRVRNDTVQEAKKNNWFKDSKK